MGIFDINNNSGNDRYENAIAKGWTRHEVFEEILRNHPPKRHYEPGDHIILLVKFQLNGGTYCYRCFDDVYEPGDLVTVNVRGELKVVQVDSVGYYSDDEYPFKDIYVRAIEGPARGDLADQYRKAIDKAKQKQEDEDYIRALAQRELEEAKAMKSEAARELAKAEKERKDAAIEREAAAKERDEAATKKAQAAEALEAAQKQLEEAEMLLHELERKRDETKEAVEATERAGEEARREYERLKEAEKEAAKVWKHDRPETDNEIIRNLRSVQDALDEDEQIYLDLEALEEKITKVIKKADEMLAEGTEEYNKQRIRMLYKKYLPKTIEVMEQYRNIFTSGLPPKNVEALRGEVLEAIDKSNQVYNNILESLYEKDMLELYSEMKSLQTLFAIQGLLDPDFDIRGEE